MKLSVLLPVYNAGNFLERAIVSILSQDFADFEFIIIDDASKDDSAKVIREFASRDSRIKPVYHEKNAGLSATLNEGLELAAAPYVVRMDQDDESLPRRLGMQYVFARSRPNLAAAGSFVYHIGITPKHDTLVRLPVSSADIVRQLESTNCLYHPSVIMNRAMVLKAGGYRQQFKNSEDYDLWLRLRKSHEFANIPVPLLRYNFTIDGMTLGRKWEQSRYAFLAQEANRDSKRSWDEIERIATHRYLDQDKTIFLNHVLLGNLSELLRLGRIDEANQLTERFCGDISSAALNDPPVAWFEALAQSGREKLIAQRDAMGRGIETLRERVAFALTLKDGDGKASARQEEVVAALQQEIETLQTAVWAAQCQLDDIRRTQWGRFVKNTSDKLWAIRTKYRDEIKKRLWILKMKARGRLWTIRAKARGRLRIPEASDEIRFENAKSLYRIHKNTPVSDRQFHFFGWLLIGKEATANVSGSADLATAGVGIDESSPGFQSSIRLRYSGNDRWLVLARFVALDGSDAQIPRTQAAWPKTKPLVSVIISCRNSGNGLMAAVNSALAQTWRELEVVIVDHGSDEPETIRILDSLHLPRASVTRGFNSAIAAAAGKYVCCLNADDKLEPAYIEKCLLRLEIEGYGVCGIWQGEPGIEAAALRPEGFDFGRLFKSDWPLKRAVFPRHLLEEKIDPTAVDDDEDLEFQVRPAPLVSQSSNNATTLSMHRSHEPGLREKFDSFIKKAVTERPNVITLPEPPPRRSGPWTELLDREPNSEKVRVLVCLPFLTIGGVEKILSQICCGLKAEGFHFTVITTVRTLSSQGNSAEWFEPATSEIFCLPECLAPEAWKGFVPYLISSRQVDILLQAGSGFIYDLLPDLKTQFPELKVVDNLFNEVGHTANNRKHDCLIDLHIVESNAIKRWLTEHGESEDRIRVIPNGVELASFEAAKRPPAPFDTHGRGFIVGFFGRLSEEKGPDLFVEIAERLKHEKNILFVIGGQGVMENAVRAQIARRGLEDSVKMLGFCSVETHLACCDLLLLPSRQDGRPNVVMEAMAMGVPVIASRVGGLAELVQEGYSGYLCDAVDTRQFAEKIAMLAHDPVLCEKLRAGAQLHAREHFDIRQTVAAFSSAFRELLRQPTPAPAQLVEVAAE